MLEGKNCCEVIEFMLGIDCFFIDLLFEEVKEFVELGVLVVVIFLVILSDKKLLLVEEVYNLDVLV